MAILNQIVAVEKGTKSRAYGEFTQLHQEVQKEQLLSGLSRTYTPLDDEGEDLPGESQKVQIRTIDVLDRASELLSNLFDVVLTKENANTQARGTVVVDNETLLEDIPVTYLLFLEKQMTDLRTFVAKLPTLSQDEEWHWDDRLGVWKTDPVETIRSKKVPRNHVKAEPTPEHPAQVEVWHEDVPVGRWHTVKFSGAIPASHKRIYLERVEKLIDAVKFAREEANSREVEERRNGTAVFNYLFAEIP